MKDKTGTIKRFETGFFLAPNEIFGMQISAIKEIKKGNIITAREKINRNINGNEIAVYLYICRLANNKESAFPSYNTIAENCGMSRMTAIKCIEVLEKNKLIIKKQRLNPYSDEFKNYSNVYEVLIPNNKKI